MTVDYMNVERKEVRQFNFSFKDGSPETTTVDGVLWKKCPRSRLTVYEDTVTKEPYDIDVIDYEFKTGVPADKYITDTNGKTLMWIRNVDGIPAVADLHDVLRRSHQTGYQTAFKKPPLEFDSKRDGYGLV